MFDQECDRQSVPQKMKSPTKRMGKRHNYQCDELSDDFERTARSLGFSPNEISELVRIYQLPSNGTEQ